MKRWIVMSAAAWVAIIGLALVEPASEAQARLFGGGNCCGKCHGGHKHHRHRHRCHGRCSGYDACQAYASCCGQAVSACDGHGAVQYGAGYRGEAAPVPESSAPVPPPSAPEATTPAAPSAPMTPPPPSGDTPTSSEATTGA